MAETLKQKAPEHREQSRIDETLGSAATRIAELGFDPSFQQLLAEKNIPLDTDNPDAYWGAVAEHVDQLVADPSLDPLERDSLATVAYLPLALTHSYYLERHMDQLDPRQKRTAKETASSYNSLLRHFVTTYPQSSDGLLHALQGATLEIMGADADEFTRFAEQHLAARLRGVKHEIGFGRILDSLGVAHRDATLDEDLKGKDLIISYRGRDIGVDVKASLDQVDAKNRGSNGTPVAHKPGGDLIIFSMLRDADFDGTFEPNPKRVADIGPAAGAILQRALNEAVAKS
jgi:hypothetical protein